MIFFEVGRGEANVCVFVGLLFGVCVSSFVLFVEEFGSFVFVTDWGVMTVLEVDCV